MEEILKLIGKASSLISAGVSLIPEIEALRAELGNVLGSHDDAYVKAQIDQLHNVIASTGAQIDALRDPPAKATK